MGGLSLSYPRLKYHEFQEAAHKTVRLTRIKTEHLQKHTTAAAEIQIGHLRQQTVNTEHSESWEEFENEAQGTTFGTRPRVGIATTIKDVVPADTCVQYNWK